MKIKELSQKYGISEYTLRYYEKEGLIKDVPRDNNGYRIYTEENMKQLEDIECLQKAGLSLKEIKCFLYEFEQGSFKEKERLFTQQKKKLENKLCELQEALDWTEYKIWYYQNIHHLKSKNKNVDCESMKAYYHNLLIEENK